MAVKKAKTTSKKSSKKEPTPSAILKKVATVSDNSKILSKEIKSMSKIFAENQKILLSMKNMIDTLTNALEHIQKQTKQINILEEDTQKLFTGLNQVRAQSSLITKINDQTARLQEQIKQIEESQKTSHPQQISQKLSDNAESIKNNSQMIIKIAQRIDEVKDDLRQVSSKAESVKDLSKEIDEIKNNLDSIVKKSASLDSQSVEYLKEELQKVIQKTETFTDLRSEIENIQTKIELISNQGKKIENIDETIENLKEQLNTIYSKTESMSNLSGKIDQIETQLSSLAKRTESTAFVGEALKEVQKDFADFKANVFNKTNTIEQKITGLAESLKRTESASSEFHSKTDKIFTEIQSLRDSTSKATADSSKEMMALLKLSEFQSNIRITAETKYGELKDIEKMAEQTVQIINLFDKISIETQEKMPVPQEVRKWAIAKILDCADKWEIRFSDVFNILINNLGRELLKESIVIQQVRDIYGIRAVDEIRKELGIT